MNSENRLYSIYLALICVAIFALQNFIRGFTERIVLNQISWQQPWRFLSAMFAHASGSHLIYNMFALIFFGLILESIIGTKKYVLLYLSSGIIVNIISVNFYSSSLGASGAIFGIIGCLTALRPKLMVWAFSLPMPMFLASLLWALGDLIGVFIPLNNTANLAHLVGLALGLVLGLILRKTKTRKKAYAELNYQIPEKYMKSEETHFLND